MANTESKTRIRRVLRRQFVKIAIQLEDLLGSESIDETKRLEVSTTLMTIKDLYSQIKELDNQVREDLVTAEKWDERELEKEVEESTKYGVKFMTLEIKVKTILCENKAEPKQIFKLPILEIKKFNGNIKDWLSFWGQFKKIDENTHISNIDKFQYLIQNIQEGTDVKSFVDSFPMADNSYALCVKELKSRYARDDLLIQLYVRELLSLILKKQEDTDITSLYDQINSHLRSLEILNVTQEKYAAFLLPMVESALPTELLRTWERSRPADLKDELNCLLEFIRKEVESEQRILLANNFTTSANRKSQEPAAACLLAPSNSARPKELVCIWCDGSHASTDCFKIVKMNIEQRREYLRKKNACALCLKIGHHAKRCKLYIKCFVCGQRHSPVLCPGNVQPKKQNQPEEKTPTVQNLAGTTPLVSTTLLQTLNVNLCYEGRTVTVRALFDSGSQRSYVKEDIMEKLGVKPSGTEGLSHSLFGGNTVSFKKYNSYDLTIQSLDSTFEIMIKALGQPTICKSVPKFKIIDNAISQMLKRNHIMLTDTHNNSTDIGLLIGADYLGFLTTNTFIQLDASLTAIKTNLGWTLLGKTNNAIINTNIVASLFCSESLQDFWNLELLGIRDPIQVQSKQECVEEVIRNFKETIKRNDEGRYEVQLPWKIGHDDLLTNHFIATRRLRSATEKLVMCGKFQDYNKVFCEWERDGIIEVVPECELKKDGVHYLPHRAVIKESSLTTKLRPVFDASAKDRNGKSLNACLEKGFNFLDKIPDLIIGFRKGMIGISADIAKAFLQISVTENDRDYLRFLWWNDESRHDIREYRHCRVVFGLTSSPFLLSATIQHHLQQIKGKQKEAADYLASSFYVDNVIMSLDTEEETQKFIQEAKTIMKEGKFDLRQWVTAPMEVNEMERDVISILGLLWDTKSDELFCNLQALPDPTEIGKSNKRTLLSLTQQIFDPLGILCPVTLVPRLILQEMWNRKINWDEELPSDIELRESNDSTFRIISCADRL